jgi:hypothetical protein
MIDRSCFSRVQKLQNGKFCFWINTYTGVTLIHPKNTLMCKKAVFKEDFCPSLQKGWLWYIQCVSDLWQPARVWSSFWCLCSWCGVVCALRLWSSFPIFLVILVRVFFIHAIKSCMRDMFRCGELLRSVLLLLRRRLLRFQVSLRDSERIVMWYLWMLDRSVFGSIKFLGSWIVFYRILLLLIESMIITRFWL